MSLSPFLQAICIARVPDLSSRALLVSSVFLLSRSATPRTLPPCTNLSSWARGSFFFRLAPFGALAFEAPEPILRERRGSGAV